ncbi:hypothetical protein Ea92_26 [Erwinia phage Ea9-2]|uniref:Uncharacterized protein n=1 Tax=Erwinia phage Ea9-2 TaxID=1429767 RepID=W6AQT0_9CAUD|nr:hypothetical protein Ea92_26 [Erwinia phage Ea9-2]AHI60083.1 hypothetical protein Ea92_26 [Erwinia phage Ea9-2]
MTNLVRLGFDEDAKVLHVVDHDKGEKLPEGVKDLGLAPKATHELAAEEKLNSLYNADSLSAVSVVYGETAKETVAPVEESSELSTQHEEVDDQVNNPQPEPAPVTDPVITEPVEPEPVVEEEVQPEEEDDSEDKKES